MKRGWCLASVVAMCFASGAWADALDVSLTPKARLGQGFPAINIQILEKITGFKLDLKRADGKVIHLEGGGPPGITRKIDLPQPEGAFHYEGQLTAVLPDGSDATLPLSFDTELWGPVKLTLSEKDLDLASRKLTFRLSRPAGKAQLTVMSESGVPIYDGEIAFKGEPRVRR